MHEARSKKRKKTQSTPSVSPGGSRALTVPIGGNGFAGIFSLHRGVTQVTLDGVSFHGPSPPEKEDSGGGWISVELMDHTTVTDFQWQSARRPLLGGRERREQWIAAYRGTGVVKGRTGQNIALTAAFSRLAQDALSVRICVESLATDIIHKITLEPLRDLALPDGWNLTVPTCGGWCVRAADYPSGYSMSLRYPVNGSLQWIELFGEEAGISFGTLDRSPWLKDFAVARIGDVFRLGVAHPYVQLQAGKRLVLPPIYIRLHRGGWQHGAAWYRRWLRSFVPRPKAPKWLMEKPAWSWVSVKNQYAEVPGMTYRGLPERSEAFGKMGLPLIQVAAWFEHGHDTRYPDYVAGESLGGEAELSEAVKEIHSAHRFVALYTNGRIVDPLSRTLSAHPHWNEWLVQAPEGRRYRDFQGRDVSGIEIDVPRQDWDPNDLCAKERYGEVVFGVMCPSVRAWQRVLSKKLAYLARTYKIDGVYIDQVLGAIALPCYAKGHGHHRPMKAWQGYHRLLRRARRRLKAARPRAYLATEGVSDILSRYFDIVQSHNDWRGKAPPKAFPMPELLRFTMPRLIQACGPVYSDDRFLLRLAHVAASGLDVACHVVDPDSPFAVRLKKISSWRMQYGSDFLRGEPLVCSVAGFPRLRAMAIHRQHRVYVFTADLAVDAEPLPISIDVAWRKPTPLRLVFWESEDQDQGRDDANDLSAVSVEVLDGRIRLEYPPHETGLSILER